MTENEKTQEGATSGEAVEKARAALQAAEDLYRIGLANAERGEAERVVHLRREALAALAAHPAAAPDPTPQAAIDCPECGLGSEHDPSCPRKVAPDSAQQGEAAGVIEIAARIFDFKPHKLSDEFKAKYLRFADEIRSAQQGEDEPPLPKAVGWRYSTSGDYHFSTSLLDAQIERGAYEASVADDPEFQHEEPDPVFTADQLRADRRTCHAHMMRKLGAPVAWIATDLDGRGDVAFTKEEAKSRAGEGCTEFVPLYDIGDDTLACAAGAERAVPEGEPNMLWEAEDPEDTYGDSPQDFAENYASNCMNGGEEEVVDVLCAHRGSNRQMRIITPSDDDVDGRVSWSWIAAAPSPAAAKEGDLTAVDCPVCKGKGGFQESECGEGCCRSNIPCDECSGQGKVIVSRRDLAAQQDSAQVAGKDGA